MFKDEDEMIVVVMSDDSDGKCFGFLIFIPNCVSIIGLLFNATELTGLSL
jgi:hypothetical protein